jgi:DNA-binding beta-propeller fold protein YncE
MPPLSMSRLRLPLVALPVALCAALGCSHQAEVRRDGAVRYWPAPPELPRFAYEATLRDGDSLRPEREGDALRRIATGVAAPVDAPRKPLAVAAAGARVYVTDTEARRVFVFDLARRRTFAFGMRLQGELTRPAGIAVDGHGDVYVVDAGARRVLVYDALGMHKRTIEGGRDWVRPTAVAVDARGGAIYVVDTGGIDSDAHRVHAYDADGTRRFVLGRRGGAPAEFNLPVDAAVAPDGTLYVLDAGNFRVQAFDRGGRWLRAFGSAGNGFGQFARPRGIAVDRTGIVYVTDASFGNVQVFDPAGRLLVALGERAAGDMPAGFALPAGIAVDEAGHVYVVDQFFRKVEVMRRLSEEEARRLADSRAAGGR